MLCCLRGEEGLAVFMGTKRNKEGSAHENMYTHIFLKSEFWHLESGVEGWDGGGIGR